MHTFIYTIKLPILISLVTALSIASSLLISSTAHAVPYGQDGYGNCVYSRDCPAPTSSPIPVTPPIVPASPVVNIEVNLAEGEKITEKNVPLVATFYTLDGETKIPVPVDGIGWVAFYVDDVLIDTVYSPKSDDSFELVWHPGEAGDKVVTAVAYDKEGAPLARQDIPVTVTSAAVTIPSDDSQTSGNGSGEQRSSNRGGGIPGSISEYLETTFENVSVPKTIKEVPYFVAQTFPLWLFIILFLTAFRLCWQAIRETVMLYRIEKAIALEKRLAEQKIAFVMVISHYLNTPLTLIRNGTEVLSGITPEAKYAVQLAVDDMKLRVDKVLSDTTASKELAVIEPPRGYEKKFSPLRSPSFWVPVAVVVAIMFFANGLLLAFNKTDIVVGDQWFRFALIFMGIVFVALSVRSQHVRTQERNFAAQRLTYEQNLDRVRSDFIVRASTSLRSGITLLETAQKQLTNARGTKFFDEGLAQIDRTVYKLELSLRIRADTAIAQALAKIPLHQVFEQAFEARHTTIAEHGIYVENQVGRLAVPGNPEFLSFVGDSLVDNAIKFTKDGGSIRIRETKNNGIVVEDNGVGISQQALTNLFEPFSRGTSTAEYTYEGLGFSLYLTKLIIERMGGTINIVSTEGAGTKVAINFPS
jgi:signal transduction histidine kinase